MIRFFTSMRCMMQPNTLHRSHSRKHTSLTRNPDDANPATHTRHAKAPARGHNQNTSVRDTHILRYPIVHSIARLSRLEYFCYLASHAECPCVTCRGTAVSDNPWTHEMMTASHKPCDERDFTCAPPVHSGRVHHSRHFWTGRFSGTLPVRPAGRWHARGMPCRRHQSCCR